MFKYSSKRFKCLTLHHRNNISFNAENCGKKMSRMGVVLLMTFASSVYQFSDAENLDKIIGRCEMESKIFAKGEDKYIDKSNREENEPDLAGRQFDEMQFMAYEREKFQRPFECISNRINETSEMELVDNIKYQTLVEKCKARQTTPYCDIFSPYRTIDGTCNNLLNPKWGSIFSCVRRLMPPSYEGSSDFRRSVRGEPLPDPRFLSLYIPDDTEQPSKDLTHMLAFFGQFVAHDMVDTPITFIGNETVDCCSHPNGDQHPQCAPILLKKDDPFYSQFNVTCFNFVRSTMCDSCIVGKRNQMNHATSFLDLSPTYGSIISVASRLRQYDGTGKLKIQKREVGDLLPPNDEKEICGKKEREEYCFSGGDRRTNQHTVLSSIQTLLMREHNRIAEKFKDLNPHWKEEILFQETRKLLIALYQKILYKDFLPLLIGHNLTSNHKLSVQIQGRTVYDPLIDPTTLTECNAAAYRLHSILKGVVTDYKVERGKRLFRNQSLDVTPLYHGMIDSLMGGITLSPAKKFDNQVTNEVSSFLYRMPKGSYGFDLVSVDIQRGRDLGLPSYADAIYYLSDGQIYMQNFEDLQKYMDRVNVELLKKMYSHVKDIDLWVGMINERVPNGMSVGPTTGEIIGRQFHRLMYGDRFHFQNDGQFNDDQLQSIKESSLSKMMCDNLEIRRMQENAFLFPSPKNPVRLCEEIPGVNLDLWKD